ncbi:MAG: hypothetical protein ACR2JB_23880 [Bryobacteraceae bacterium]
MKISHKQLEECRQQPRQWLVNGARSYTGPRRLGYAQVLQLAIHRYHKDQAADAARQHMSTLIARADFRDPIRVDLTEASLDSYIDWHGSSSTITADHRVRLSLDLRGYLALSGELSRVDITPEGYRGILLGVPPRGWRDQLRMPLLQRALATKYGRPVNEISVGIQDLDGSGLAVTSFSSRRIAEAERGFLDLGNQIRRLVDQVRE